MTSTPDTERAAPASGSPFHRGEVAVQTRLGVAEKIDGFARRVIRDHMPQQYREFFAQLPFIALGAVDEDGWPWAALRFGEPGFLATPDDRTLEVTAHSHPDDPVDRALVAGHAVGVLGLEFGTRRRNRLSTRVRANGAGVLTLDVVQAFGNCPQYIQTRDIDSVRPAGDLNAGCAAEQFTVLSAAHAGFIRAADTFFVASAVPATDDAVTEGADVSHRGGRPGFVRVDGNVLTIPDFPGNLHYNTLGNFLVNPRAGLTFVDFDSGDLLMLSGTVEILWSGDPLLDAFKGAERAWRFTLAQGLMFRGVLPLRGRFRDYSPNTLLTGDWAQAAATLAADRLRDQWRPFRIARVDDESETIRSFHLEAADGHGVPAYEAGQYLTLRIATGSGDPVIRTYTASSSPHDPLLRISVKREPGGVSEWLHAQWTVGARVEAKAPRGGFWIDPQETRPALLVAGGVGITPILSMARHVMHEGVRTRRLRPLTIFHVARTRRERAFFETLTTLAAGSGGAIRYFSFLTAPDETAKPGIDFDGSGRLTADSFRQRLPLDDYDAYLCGPAGFMQSTYDALRDLGMRDTRIHAEAFGPAALTRRADDVAAVAAPAPAEADAAVIRFVKSGFEQRWNRGDATLLETAEAHGLSAAYSCRRGVCGSCATRLVAGKVVYRTPPGAAIGNDDVLICCAVPAAGCETVALDL